MKIVFQQRKNNDKKKKIITNVYEILLSINAIVIIKCIT